MVALDTFVHLLNNDNLHHYHAQLFHFIAPLSLLYGRQALEYVWKGIRKTFSIMCSQLCKLGKQSCRQWVGFSHHILTRRRPVMSELSYHLTANKVFGLNNNTNTQVPSLGTNEARSNKLGLSMEALLFL